MLGTLNPRAKEVIVVGAGIAGLSVAYALDQAGYEVRLFDEAQRVGGLIRTDENPWGLSEAGAPSLLLTKEIEEFLSPLKMEWLEACPRNSARYILRNGKLRRFPFTVTEAAQIFSRILFKKAPTGDTSHWSVADWTEHFLGEAALEFAVQPMIQSVYGTRASEILIQSASGFPPVSPGESLARALISRKKKTAPVRMVSPASGMGSLVESLGRRLQERLKDRMVLGAPVSSLPTTSNIVLAVPAFAASSLLSKIDPDLSKSLEKVSYTPLVKVTAYLLKNSFRNLPTGLGVLMPLSERRTCLGILFDSNIFSRRVVNEEEFFACTFFLGGSLNPHLYFAENNEIQQLIEHELRNVFNFTGTIEHLVIHRCDKAIPKYDSNLYQVWNQARQGWCSVPGRMLFGNYSGKVGLRGMIETAASLA